MFYPISHIHCSPFLFALSLSVAWTSKSKNYQFFSHNEYRFKFQMNVSNTSIHYHNVPKPQSNRCEWLNEKKHLKLWLKSIVPEHQIKYILHIEIIFVISIHSHQSTHAFTDWFSIKNHNATEDFLVIFFLIAFKISHFLTQKKIILEILVHFFFVLTSHGFTIYIHYIHFIFQTDTNNNMEKSSIESSSFRCCWNVDNGTASMNIRINWLFRLI